jgi:hypothetical protein
MTRDEYRWMRLYVAFRDECERDPKWPDCGAGREQQQWLDLYWDSMEPPERERCNRVRAAVEQPKGGAA